jgi:hypothetical protein
MRIIEIITEVFNPNKAAPISWANAHNAVAVVSDTQDLSVRFISHGKNLWAIEFNINNDYEMTGGGNVSVIFATVIEAVKQFIKKERMDEFGGAFFFTAEEKSRAKMYDTLAKRVAKQVGWHVVPYDEMIADPKYKTPLSYGDYLFAIEPGPAPEHRAAAQKPQHGEFLTIYHVVNMEDPTHPAIRIKAKNGDEAERWVMKNVPEYKDVDPFAVFARKVPPDNRPIIDKGTVPPPTPKPAERVPTPLEQKLRAKLGA